MIRLSLELSLTLFNGLTRDLSSHLLSRLRLSSHRDSRNLLRKLAIHDQRQPFSTFTTNRRDDEDQQLYVILLRLSTGSYRNNSCLLLRCITDDEPSPPLLEEKVSQGSLRCTIQCQTYDHERTLEQGAPREIQCSCTLIWSLIAILTFFRSAQSPSEKTTKSLSYEAPTRAAKARSPPFTVSSTSSTSSVSSRRSQTANPSPSASTHRRLSSPS